MNKKIIIWMVVLFVLSSFAFGDICSGDGYTGFWQELDNNDISGNTYVDNAGNVDFTIGAEVTTGQTNLIYTGESADFSGAVNGNLVSTNKDIIPDGTPMSMEVWFNVDTVSGDGYILNLQDDDATPRILFKIDDQATDQMQIALKDRSENGPEVKCGVIETGKDYYVMAYWDGTDTLTVYINNTLCGSITEAGTDFSLSDNNYWTIGSKVDGSERFDGRIDNVVVTVNKTFTPIDFAERFNSGSGVTYNDICGGTVNFSTSLAYPTNETTYYGDYSGFINITLSNVNGSATCTINDTRWGFYSNDNTTYSFLNNTDITDNNISISVNCSDNNNWNVLDFWFYLETILDIYVYDESTLTLLDQPITLDLISSNGDFIQNYTFNKNMSVFSLPEDDYELSYTSSGYSQRQGFLKIESGKKYNQTLFLLNSSLGSQVLSTLYDEFGKKTAGYYIKTYHRILGNYYLVETSKTNTNGETDMFCVLNTPMYYFIIENQDGEVYKQTQETEIYGTSLEFNIQITAAIGHIFDKLGDYIFSLTFDNATNVWTYIFNDQASTSTNNKLAIYKYSDRSLIAKNETSSTSGVLTINMNGLYENGTTYLALATANASPEFGIDAKTYTYNTTPMDIEEMGLLITMILLLLMGFVAFWNPAIMFVMEALAIILTRITNLHTLEYSTTIILTATLLIIAYIVSDKS